MRPRLDFREMFDLAKDAGVTAEELQTGLVEDVTDASIVANAAAKAKAPVFTGELAGGIGIRGVRITSSSRGVKISDVVFATSPHALVQEEGRAPGATTPPLGPIFRWVQLRQRRNNIDLSWTGEEGDDAALVAAIKLQHVIGKRGLAPRRFMEAGADAGQAELERRLLDRADTIRRRME